MQGSFRSLLALILVPIVLSSTLIAQGEKAILYPAPEVTLNGSAIQTSSAVLSGDKVQTGGANAQMTAHSLMASVYTNTMVQYGDVILLSCGGILVSSDSYGVQTSDTRVTPVGGTAKFEVVNRGGKLAVNVQSGTVRVSSDEVATLNAGQSTERASSDGCPVAAKPPASSAQGGKGKWILLGAAAGAGAGVYIAERGKSSPDAR